MIHIDVYVRKDTALWPIGRELLSAMMNESEDLRPDRVRSHGMCCPPKKLGTGEFHELEACKPAWEEIGKFSFGDETWDQPISVEWDRKAPLRYTCYLSHSWYSRKRGQTTGDLRCEFSHSRPNWPIAKTIDWLHLFTRWAEILDTHVASLHIPHRRDQEARSSHFRPGFLGPLEGPQLDDFGWATIFGARRIDAVPVAALRAEG